MRRTTVAAVLLGIALAGCSSEQPIMTVEQQKSFNQCMSGRWSGEADTFLWGPLGWAYHDSLQKDCYTKAAELGSTPAAEQSGAAGSAAVAPRPASSSAVPMSERPAQPKAQ